MGRRDVSDLEAKLFEEKQRGCLAVLVGPRKVGEVDIERSADGAAKMVIALKGARLPEGTRRVSVVINQTPFVDLDVRAGTGFLRLDTASGNDIPEVQAEDTAEIRAGDVTVCSGTFHRD